MAKKQHYVPQFLLRNWSQDKASINVFLCDKNEIIVGAPIKSQSQEQFYYGEDQKIENLLCELEKDASVIVNKLIAGETDLADDDKRVLLHFVAMQNARTPQRMQKLDDSITELAKSTLRKDKRIKNKNDIKNVKVSINNHSFWQLTMYLQSFLIYSDLRIAILKSLPDMKFVIGQDPVVITNKFLTERNWPLSKKGLGMKGVTVFLPISPDYLICLYDNSTYTFRGNKRGEIISKSDIEELNKLQFCNTKNSIYISQNDQNFIKYSNDSASYRNTTSARVEESDIINNKQVVLTGSKDYPFNPTHSFLILKERCLYIPLDYKYLERPILEDSKSFLKSDPRLASIIT